jgi:hypothetical protein
MKTMVNDSSATAHEEKTHVNRTTRTNNIINALKERAQSVVNDRSIDPEGRAIIRYALETNDPWLAELVRRAEAGEKIVDTIDFSETPEIGEAESKAEKIEALAEIICRDSDEPGTKSAALLVLMAMLDNATDAKALARVAKHVAYTRCGDLNVFGIADTQIALLENELLGDAIRR